MERVLWGSQRVLNPPKAVRLTRANGRSTVGLLLAWQRQYVGQRDQSLQWVGLVVTATWNGSAAETSSAWYPVKQLEPL